MVEKRDTASFPSPAVHIIESYNGWGKVGKGLGKAESPPLGMVLCQMEDYWLYGNMDARVDVWYSPFLGLMDVTLLFLYWSIT